MEVFTSISLAAAFVAGMVALFAPCCITYLLPAYFGNIFREKRRVLLMTLIYSLGIFTVMLPVVLGAKALSLLFFRLHDQTYYVGGAFMIVLAGLTLLGVKLPMPRLQRKNGARIDIWSTYTLGLFSGVTSSCCAPVLIGVMALSSLSPSLLMALLVGVTYVLGMVSPLYLASAFIDRRNILERPVMRRKLGTIRILGREYSVLLSNMVAAAVFLVTGVGTILLARAGLLGMDIGESPTTKLIQTVALSVTDAVGRVPGLDWLFLGLAGWLLFKLVRWSRRK